MEILDFNKEKVPDKIMRELRQLTGSKSAFVGLDDTFNFTCLKCNNCCKHCPGEIGFTIPQLKPFDIIMLSRFLKTTTSKFVERYAEFVQKDRSQITSGILKFVGDEQEMRCPFLDDSGCSVHEAKPMICRLYPLGFYPVGDKALVISQKGLELCQGESGQKHTVRQWLNDSGALYYFKNEKYFDIISSMDIEKFNNLSEEDQSSFYVTLYDIDRGLDMLGYSGLFDSAEELMDVCCDSCKTILEYYGCLLDSAIEGEGKD